jgi:hypothetical protein
VNGYSIFLIGFSIAGAFLLLWLVFEDRIAEWRSSANLDSLKRAGARVEESAEQTAEEMIRVREQVAKMAAKAKARDFQKFRGGSGEPSAELGAEKPGKDKDDLESWRLFVSTSVPDGVEEAEFPVRVYARENAKGRKFVRRLLILLRSART